VLTKHLIQARQDQITLNQDPIQGRFIWLCSYKYLVQGKFKLVVFIQVSGSGQDQTIALM